MKTAIVTGVSRGLGEALVRALLAGGFAVTGIGRTSGAAPNGAHYRFVACDLTDTTDIDAALTPAFRAIADAYRVLNDPERRAAYDVNLHAHRQMRWRIFDQRQAAVGKTAEKAKRRGILELLYTSRLNQPAQPSLTLHELEDLLGCPREHLEFTLWYLKENGLVTRTDNGRYAITVKGVDLAEQFEREQLSPGRLLPAAQAVEQII